MKKRFTPRIIASTVVILLGMVKTKNWNDGTSNFPEPPNAIQLISHVGGHFAETGVYKIEDSEAPIYSNKNGCSITKIQGLESCGLENCRKTCFGEGATGPCYEANCPNKKNSPPTIFLNCTKYGPQTCTNAEYVPYEDSYEEGLMIKNTDKFSISGVLVRTKHPLSFEELPLPDKILYGALCALLLILFDLGHWAIKKRGVFHWIYQQIIFGSRTDSTSCNDDATCHNLDIKEMDQETPEVRNPLLPDKMEDWSKVKDEITPDNLMTKFGNPDITTVASCLDLLPNYNHVYGPGKPQFMVDDKTKFNGLLEMWEQRETDKEHRVSNFIKHLEGGQQRKGGFELNNMIATLKQLLKGDESDVEPVLKHQSVKNNDIKKSFEAIRTIDREASKGIKNMKKKLERTLSWPPVQ